MSSRKSRSSRSSRSPRSSRSSRGRKSRSSRSNSKRSRSPRSPKKQKLKYFDEGWYLVDKSKQHKPRSLNKLVTKDVFAPLDSMDYLDDMSLYRTRNRYYPTSEYLNKMLWKSKVPKSKWYDSPEDYYYWKYLFKDDDDVPLRSGNKKKALLVYRPNMSEKGPYLENAPGLSSIKFTKIEDLASLKPDSKPLIYVVENNEKTNADVVQKLRDAKVPYLIVRLVKCPLATAMLRIPCDTHMNSTNKVHLYYDNFSRKRPWMDINSNYQAFRRIKQHANRANL